MEFSGRAMPLVWVAWLSTVQLSMAGLCAMAVWPQKGAREYLLASIVWYIIQAVDEVVAGNFFGAGLMEYPVLAAWFAGVWQYKRRNERAAT